MHIYAPNKNATGTWCSVQFRNGVGESNDPYIIDWFVKHGYKVEAPTTIPKVEVVKEVGEVPQPDFESMTPNELRDWLRANGYGSKIKNIRNKEKLLEIVRG